MSLSGKVALVTGAARGIGRAISAQLARDGADIVLADICPPEYARVACEDVESAGARPLFVQADVGDRTRVEDLFARADAAFGRLDIVVNNAAASVRKPLLELEVSDVEKTWAVTLWGVFHCSQLGARRMAAQGEGGSILIISSVHAVRAFPHSTAYNGAKAAVNHMARTWAAELAQHRIRVNCIEPGWIDTPGERNFYTEQQIREQGQKLPFGRLGKPEEIAHAASFLVSERASYITGSVLRVDGGILLPG
jgi:glucose 1-dehydrogenase